ncbi:hypothetical protein B0T12DRAFT_35361 [Alternaria alternata]|nr:hypothetical protein B0T12DRAFT_35361 [Alternaria alternata]
MLSCALTCSYAMPLGFYALHSSVAVFVHVCHMYMASLRKKSWGFRPIRPLVAAAPCWHTPCINIFIIWAMLLRLRPYIGHRTNYVPCLTL